MQNIILFIITVLFSVSKAELMKTLELFDDTRNRIIPLAIYGAESKNNLPLVIINHGYGAKNTEYSFIATALAERGYFVVSIQHDLKTYQSLPTIGDLFQRRKPLWERGVKNILFVIAELKKTNPELNLEMNTGLEILRFGASDDQPDEGVVPDSGVRVIYVKDAKHIDLCDRGSQQIKDEIQKLIIAFLGR